MGRRGERELGKEIVVEGVVRGIGADRGLRVRGKEGFSRDGGSILFLILRVKVGYVFIIVGNR